MLKKYILPWLFFISFIAVLYVLIEKPYLPKVKNTNIFSEIYLQEKDGILAELGTSEYRAHILSERDSNGLIGYQYDGDANPIHLAAVRITPLKYGESSAESVFITIQMSLDQGLLTGRYSYDAASSVLKREIAVEFSSENDKELLEVLEDNGYTMEDVGKVLDGYLKEKILTDWCSVYDSNYSPDDWGDLTVEDWGVDDD